MTPTRRNRTTGMRTRHGRFLTRARSSPRLGRTTNRKRSRIRRQLAQTTGTTRRTAYGSRHSWRTQNARLPAVACGNGQWSTIPTSRGSGSRPRSKTPTTRANGRRARFPTRTTSRPRIPRSRSLRSGQSRSKYGLQTAVLSTTISRSVTRRTTPRSSLRTFTQRKQPRRKPRRRKNWRKTPRNSRRSSSEATLLLSFNSP
mmetsp:Transcript_8887/g.28206  ORF Transcript_8887/g.28206 Transcript_8887/m.28206 type:complete len:201 (-) Transcript_8887:713-1315(-)